MITIKGTYENGEIKLLEAAPVNHNAKVLITFLDVEEEKEAPATNTLQEQLPVMKSYLEEGSGSNPGSGIVM